MAALETIFCGGCTRKTFRQEQLDSAKKLGSQVQCRICGGYSRWCQGCDKFLPTYAHNILPLKDGGNRDLHLCATCWIKNAGTCRDCHGIAALDPADPLWLLFKPLPRMVVLDFEGSGSGYQYCTPCAEKRKGPCGACGVTSGYLVGKLTVTTWLQPGMTRTNESIRVCKACNDTRISCGACGQITIGKDCQWSHQQMRVICAGCLPHYDFCGECEERVKLRTAINCGACSPILQYGEKAERRLGFFGHPEVHEQCIKTFEKARKYGELRPLGNRHVKGCTFDGFYFGVELEVDAADGQIGTAQTLAAKVKKLLTKRAIIKRDGSVPTGFEIVTAPATLAEQRKIWSPFFDWTGGGHVADGFPYIPLVAHKAKGANCGLHIHVSRGPMSTLQIAKILQFVHSPENREFIEFMSGRPPGHYQDFLRDKCIWKGPQEVEAWTGLNGGEVVNAVRKGGPRHDFYTPRRDHGSRYTAVNLQNSQTIEFRIFKATLVPTTFWARFEFVAALVAYTRTGVASIQEMTVPAFSEWLEKKRDTVCTEGCKDCFDYKNLADHMAKGGFVAPEVPVEPPPVQVGESALGLFNNKTRKALRVRRTR